MKFKLSQHWSFILQCMLTVWVTFLGILLSIVVVANFLPGSGSAIGKPDPDHVEVVTEGNFSQLLIGKDYNRVVFPSVPVRMSSGVGIEFGHRLSTIKGDSSTVWVETRDHRDDSKPARMGMVADHNGIGGIQVFDTRNPDVEIDRANGPVKGEMFRGIAHFFMKNCDGVFEFWVRYKDDEGVSRESKLGILEEF